MWNPLGHHTLVVIACVSVECMVGGSDVDGLLDHSRVVIWAARENTGVLPVNRVAGRPCMLSQNRRIEISCPDCSLVLRQLLA